MHQAADIGMALIFVALATTLVAHPNTSKVITSFGGAFSQSIRAAQGG